MRCPGQDTRYWKPGDIYSVTCPSCGASIEFFKDEMRIRCRKCGKLVPNPKTDFGCTIYCAFAEQCVGPEPAKRLREEFKKEKN